MIHGLENYKTLDTFTFTIYILPAGTTQNGIQPLVVVAPLARAHHVKYISGRGGNVLKWLCDKPKNPMRRYVFKEVYMY